MLNVSPSHSLDSELYGFHGLLFELIDFADVIQGVYFLALEKEPELGHHGLKLKDDDQYLLQVNEFLVFLELELFGLDGRTRGYALNFYVL